ncbi:MAG: tetratricopeptide repeat protein, partial [Myxococcota bacterium]|nr:tetratricopeptide repeat protein [Myxococcota bacterium]
IHEEVTLYWFKFGRVYASNERATEALECFRTALELTPTHVPSLREAAPRLMELEDWKGAAKFYRQVLRLLGGFGDQETLTEATLNLGRCELQIGKPDAAVKRFTKILERNPNDVGALEGMADVHRQNKDWNTLLSTYNAIIKYARSADQVIDAYLQKGDILEEKLGYSDKAALHYEKVLMYDKTNHLAMLRLSEIALSREDLDKARKWAEVGERTANEASDGAGIVRSKLLQAIASAASGEDGAALTEAALADAGDDKGAVEEIAKGLASSSATGDLLKTYRKHFARL